MSKWFVLLMMLFCHIADDYYLQGILASMKQKEWWKANAPDKMYKYDYIPAIIAHSFSWAFMIMLPIAIYMRFHIGIPFVAFIAANCFVHAVTDNQKANLRQINLIEDQTMHLIQIILTFGGLVLP